MLTTESKPVFSAAYLLTLALLTTCVRSQDSTEGAPDRRKEDNGLSEPLAALTYVYDADVTPAEYLAKHPCVIGDWAYQRETDKHWIGDVHYISDNTYANSTRYAALEVKVVKTSAVNVDMKKWRGMILLEKASREAGVDDREESFLPFTIVGYSKEAWRYGLIDLFRELPYKPMN